MMDSHSIPSPDKYFSDLSSLSTFNSLENSEEAYTFLQAEDVGNWSTSHRYSSLSLLPDLFTAWSGNYNGLQCNSEGGFTLHCCHPSCSTIKLHREARNFFKSCHNCYTFYCSRKCRKDDWIAHKSKCPVSRASSGCKHSLDHILQDLTTLRVFSNLARVGYLSQGRGCIVLQFSSVELAEDFSMLGIEELHKFPIFVNLRQLQTEKCQRSNTTSFDEVLSSCKKYDPEEELVLLITVKIDAKFDKKSARPRKGGDLVKIFSTIPLSSDNCITKDSKNINYNRILLITGHLSRNSSRDRQIFFTNVIRKLRERGIELGIHFPNVYKKLVDYVDNNHRLAPIIIYPVDQRTKMTFMCVMLPSDEPTTTWTRSSKTLLDISDEFQKLTSNFDDL